MHMNIENRPKHCISMGFQGVSIGKDAFLLFRGQILVDDSFCFSAFVHELKDNSLSLSQMGLYAETEGKSKISAEMYLEIKFIKDVEHLRTY